MTNSDLHLIQVQDNVVFREKTPEKWVCVVEKNGFLKADFLQMSCALDLEIHLVGEYAKCEINSAYLLNNNNNLFLNIKVLHKSKNTMSKQQIKGIVTDSAQMQFNGTILIPKESQKCDGIQNHRGILLSDKAQIQSVPQLEIWADDVQCAHGSAVGPLNEDEMFYLQSRGISPQESKKILLQSFLGDFMPTEFNATIQQWMEENV